VCFPGEDGGRSLGEVAQRDLDAALQLLADRAQYITGSSGAAIALRRSGMSDMMCRASSGSNAPELGALLSTEFGLSGESVRTRQLLRCDDAERDMRVNREVCRELGIASVAVMPVVNDDEVLGVFELFSGKPHAFGDRDFVALKRLSEMVETAVKLARAAESVPAQLKTKTAAASGAAAESPLTTVERSPEPPPVEHAVAIKAPEASLEISAPEAEKSSIHAAGEEPPVASPGKAASPIPAPATSPAKPSGRALMWSVALDSSAESDSSEPDQSHLPAAFRNLRKCEACGFPVSAGRLLCVECEEKKWRGQLKVPAKNQRGTAAADRGSRTPELSPRTSELSPRDPGIAKSPPTAETRGPKPEAGSFAAAAPALALEKPIPSQAPQSRTLAGVSPGAKAGGPIQPAAKAEKNGEPDRTQASMQVVETIREMLPKIEMAQPPEAPASAELVLSAGLEPSQSWLVRNKVVLIAIALMAGGAIAFLMIFLATFRHP
jgi:hypothetical protein